MNPPLTPPSSGGSSNDSLSRNPSTDTTGPRRSSSPPPPSTQDLLTALHSRYRTMFDTLSQGYTRLLATEEAHIAHQETRITSLRARVRTLESALAAAEQTAADNAAALRAARQLVGLGIVVPDGPGSEAAVAQMMAQPRQLVQYRPDGKAGMEVVTLPAHDADATRGRSRHEDAPAPRAYSAGRLESFSLPLPPAVPPKSGARSIPPVPPLPKEHTYPATTPTALNKLRGKQSFASSKTAAEDEDAGRVGGWVYGEAGQITVQEAERIFGRRDLREVGPGAGLGGKGGAGGPGDAGGAGGEGGYGGVVRMDSGLGSEMDAGCGRSVKSSKSSKGRRMLGRMWRRGQEGRRVKV
ncbi:hypothetical protein EDC01DRAFT_412709 [Geopyxis carbonaria]|nr:hypothetical protein EDC01DRAFT_412709 [Geopyxis carbonaria]